jgi:hypothetical protein
MTFLIKTSDCGNQLLNSWAPAAGTDCDMACTGNNNEPCGAGNRLSLFKSPATPPTQPVEDPGMGNWGLLGCYTYVHDLILYRE